MLEKHLLELLPALRKGFCPHLCREPADERALDLCHDHKLVSADSML